MKTLTLELTDEEYDLLLGAQAAGSFRTPENTIICAIGRLCAHFELPASRDHFDQLRPKEISE